MLSRLIYHGKMTNQVVLLPDNVRQPRSENSILNICL